MKRLFPVLAVCAGISATQAAAHPHIFIDTGLEVIFDGEGRATAVRVTWAYDDFYSLMMIEDRQLDSDFDGALTADEEAALAGFDMAWDADYNGDLYVEMAGQALALGRPTDWTARYQGGRITSTHLRQIETPMVPGDDPMIFQVYDSSYYTAYTIEGTPVLTGAAPDCAAQVFEPDRDAADKALEDAMAEFSGQDQLEMQFPAVGAAYADEMRVTCPGA
jgi:polyphosphate kinase